MEETEMNNNYSDLLSKRIPQTNGFPERKQKRKKKTKRKQILAPITTALSRSTNALSGGLSGVFPRANTIGLDMSSSEMGRKEINSASDTQTMSPNQEKSMFSDTSGSEQLRKKKRKKSRQHANRYLNSLMQNEYYSLFDCQPNIHFPCGHDIADSEQFDDSAIKARKFFEWFIFPLDIEEFYEKFWEKKPFIIRRHQSNYYDGWFSKDLLDELLRNRTLNYGANIDITKYQDGKRTTLNPKGLVEATQVWSFFDEQGCSVRMLHPQQYCDSLWKMLSLLEEYWNCIAGCNAYLTPKGSLQGFAPHYDDVEAFVLQIEGAKHWKIYVPKKEIERLPRFSSGNLAQEDLDKPTIEFTLEKGDLLYFPRGVVHQAYSLNDQHSLHLTISTALKNTWYDFLSAAVPRALDLAFEESIEFRKSLPRDYFEYMGVMYSDRDNDERRKQFIHQCFELLEKTLGNIPFDSAADQMAVYFTKGRLPPYRHRTVSGSDSRIITTSRDTMEMAAKTAPILTLKSLIRLVMRSAARLAIEDDLAVIYSPVRNKQEAHAIAEVPDIPNEDDILIDFPVSYASALEYILASYPDFVSIGSIPLETDAEKLDLAGKLVAREILLVKPRNTI